MLGNVSPLLAQNTTRTKNIRKTQNLVSVNADTFFAGKSTIVPIEFDPPRIPLPVVYLQIGDSEPLPFVLDLNIQVPLILSMDTVKRFRHTTGFTMTTANEKQMGIEFVVPHLRIPTKSIEANGKAYVEIPLIPVAVDTSANSRDSDQTKEDGDIGLSRVSILQFESRIPAMPIAGKRYPAGIIGNLFTQSAAVRINFVNHTLIATSREHGELRVPGSLYLPWTVDGTDCTFMPWTFPAFSFHFPLLETVGKRAQSSLPFILGLTQTDTIVTRDVAIAFNGRLSPFRELSFLDWSMGIETHRYVITSEILLPKFLIGDHVEYSLLANVKAEIVGHSSMNYDFKATETGVQNWGILGMDVLRSFEITLDASHKQLYLKPLVKVVNHGPTAADILIKNIPSVENQVVIGSAPERAGFRQGDIIERIDGIPITNLYYRTMSEVLNSLSSPIAHLTVSRNGKEEEITYKRYPLASMTMPFETGCGLQIELKHVGDGYQGFVASIAKDSSAAIAGLQVGDTVVSVDGLVCATTPWEELQQKLARPVGTLIPVTVIRIGETKPETLSLKVTHLGVGVL
jgi:hypothetical protein